MVFSTSFAPQITQTAKHGILDEISLVRDWPSWCGFGRAGAVFMWCGAGLTRCGAATSYGVEAARRRNNIVNSNHIKSTVA